MFRKECERIAGKYKDLLEVPPRGIADLAIPCFSLSKKFKQNPEEIAKRLCDEFRKKRSPLIKEIRAIGPYVNFYMNEERFSEFVLKDLLKKRFERKVVKRKGRIILEHTSMNPSGPVHIGRLRNSVIGDSLKRLLLFAGYKIMTHYYVNDVGKQIAIIYYGIKNRLKPDKELVKEYRKYKNKSDFKTMFNYVKAYSVIEKNPEKMREVEKILLKCEAGDVAKLRSISKRCLRGQIASLKRMDINFDSFVFESKFIENSSTKKILSLLKKKLVESNGALTLDLSKYGLRNVVLARKDGTSVYLLRDIAYHLEKLKSCDMVINVLGEDHKLEFQELKTILQKFFKVKKPLNVVHYSFVNFRGLKLSTRRGRIASLDELLDEGIEKALDKIKNKNARKLAEKITVGAIKYYLIKNSPEKAITFSWDDVLNFEGESGPYLQYTYARANSILRKAKKKPRIGLLTERIEMNLVKKLSEFNSVIEKCVDELKPHYLANYMFELASSFNEYYQNIRVIGSENEEAKLALVSAVTIVLRNGLKLLGIEPLERM